MAEFGCMPAKSDYARDLVLGADLAAGAQIWSLSTRDGQSTTIGSSKGGSFFFFLFLQKKI